MITKLNVRDLFDYSEQDHGLVWLPRRGPRNWNTRFAYRRVGCVNQYGYRQLVYKRKNYSEHRVVWLWHYGVWPTQVIDHANRDRLDNRIGNLRDVSPSANRRNVDAVYLRENFAGTWTLSYTFDTEQQARDVLEYAQRISATKQREHAKFNRIGQEMNDA
jgi:hypothetical protein